MTLSVQLYTLRTLETPAAILDAAKAAGFGYVEFYGGLLAQAESFAPLLAERSLQTSGSHVALKDLVEDPARVVANARLLGITELFVPSVPVDQRDMDAAGWRALGAQMAGLADQLAADGIRLGYHNHDWDLRLKDGDLTALDLVFAAAGSAPLYWEADIAWLVRGGVDPLVWLERHASRLAAAHVKDLAPAGTNDEEAGWADVGAGVLDWTVLWPAAIANGARWMVVEHDKPLNPAQTVANSHRYLAETLL